MWFVLLTSFTQKIYRVPSSRGSKNPTRQLTFSELSRRKVDEDDNHSMDGLVMGTMTLKSPKKSSKVSKNWEKQMQLLTTCVAKCLTCIKYLWVGLLLRSLGAIFWRRTCWTGCHLSGERWYQNFVVDLIKLAAAWLIAESWKRLDVLLSVWLGSNCNRITSCITYRIKILTTVHVVFGTCPLISHHRKKPSGGSVQQSFGPWPLEFCRYVTPHGGPNVSKTYLRFVKNMQIMYSKETFTKARWTSFSQTK